MSLGPLTTTVVGSYSVPEWLERLKTDYYQRRISGAYLQQIHEVAIKAALKDQERAGVDVVSDGELRRDNDVDYFLARMPGVEIPHLAKAYYYDYYDAVVRHPIPEDGPPLGLVDDLVFTREYTDRPIKVSLTGPFSLAKRVRNEAYADEADLVMAFARVLNREARALAAAGATVLQIDEPFLAGYVPQVELAVRAINVVFDGVEAHRAVHICYGNRYAKPAWEGHYDFLFPAILEARVDQLVLEFARKGYDDLELFKRYPASFLLGLGVIDVKSPDVEAPDLVASRVRRALQILPPERIVVNPDCGLRHLPADVARAKLTAMSAGAAIARREVTGSGNRPAATDSPPGEAASDPCTTSQA
jgi:5-methyltetrahydropteroyltriglutamate--homocysteine methyltransferase